jgi:hypothetical protein
MVVGCTKRQFQTSNLLKVDSKPYFLKINNLLVVIFQNVLMDLKILKEKQIYLFFQCFLESLCPFKKLNVCVFPISYPCLHVISYKC